MSRRRHALFAAGDRVVAKINDNAVGKSWEIRGVVDSVETFQGEPGRIVYVASPQSKYRGQAELAWARNIRHDDALPTGDPGQLW